MSATTTFFKIRENATEALILTNIVHFQNQKLIVILVNAIYLGRKCSKGQFCESMHYLNSLCYDFFKIKTVFHSTSGGLLPVWKGTVSLCLKIEYLDGHNPIQKSRYL